MDNWLASPFIRPSHYVAMSYEMGVCALETTHMKAIFDRDKKCHASPIGDTILYVLFAWPPHNTFSSGVGVAAAALANIIRPGFI